MGNSIGHEESFEGVLTRLAEGLTLEDRKRANKAGADIFAAELKAKTPRSDRIYHDGTPHIQDAVLVITEPSGRVDVGYFSAKTFIFSNPLGFGIMLFAFSYPHEKSK